MRAESGYSLVEVLVAFAILATSLGTLFSAFGTTARLSQVSEERTIAILHARSVLDGLSLEPIDEPTVTSGELDEVYRWETEIRPYGTEDDHEAWIATPYEISVSILWTSGVAEKSVRLDTVRLLPKVP